MNNALPAPFALNEAFTKLCAKVMAEKPPAIRLCGRLYRLPKVETSGGAVMLKGQTAEGRAVHFAVFGNRPEQIECLHVTDDGVIADCFTPGSRQELNTWAGQMLAH